MDIRDEISKKRSDQAATCSAHQPPNPLGRHALAPIGNCVDNNYACYVIGVSREGFPSTVTKVTKVHFKYFKRVGGWVRT